MTNLRKRFLIVDDDPQNNSISKMTLRKSYGDIEVKDFLVPENALDFIESEFSMNKYEVKTILFLDINMPTLTGWEFLEKFEEFNEPIKNQFDIYMLSSSIDPADIERARLNPLVIDFIEKPLSMSTLAKIFV